MFGLITRKKAREMEIEAYEIGYDRGYSVGHDIGESEGIHKKYTPNELRKLIGLPPIREPLATNCVVEECDGGVKITGKVTRYGAEFFAEYCKDEVNGR